MKGELLDIQPPPWEGRGIITVTCAWRSDLGIVTLPSMSELVQRSCAPISLLLPASCSSQCSHKRLFVWVVQRGTTLNLVTAETAAPLPYYLGYLLK
jgi:hypothetical protein